MMDEHVAVLFREVLDFLQPRSGGRYIDGTVGAGGHTAGILEASAPDGQLLAFDRDLEAIRFSRERLQQFGDRLHVVHASYGAMAELAPAYGFAGVDGVLLDLGLSSRQLENAERGFSFLHDGPLDMRFDTTQGVTAATLVNRLPEKELADLFWRYGEEENSRRYARTIVARRPLQTTRDLAELIEEAAPRAARRRRIHPATRLFQALRIAVNDELSELEQGLPAAIDLLRSGGRVAVISFHSLEDRYVKNLFRDLARDCVCPPRQPVCTCDTTPMVRLVTRKAVKAGEEEVSENPRSRSARLRVAEKL